MKFYGMLFGQEKRADSLFNVVASLFQGLEAWAGERSADSVSRNIQGVVDGDAREWVVQDV